MNHVLVAVRYALPIDPNHCISAVNNVHPLQRIPLVLDSVGRIYLTYISCLASLKKNEQKKNVFNENVVRVYH